MKFQKYLTEKYWGRVESRWTGMNLEIFENPSKKEFLDAAAIGIVEKYVRFIADPKRKKVYVWSANAIHADMVPEIYNKSYANVIFKVLPGTAKQQGGRWVIIATDEVEVTPDRYNWIMQHDWSWADRYIEVTPWIKKLRIGKAYESKLEKYLTEKWVHSTNIRPFGKTLFVEIFQNPSKAEYRDAAKASKTGIIPALRGRLATGFITPQGDVWLWRGDVWHYDLPQDALNKIGSGTKGFHFGFSENEVSLYSSEFKQITKKLALKLVDRLAKIEPKLKTAQILIDDMYLDQIEEDAKWYLKTTVKVRQLEGDKFNVFTTRSGNQERKGFWSRSKKLNQTKQQVDKWIEKVKKDSETVEVINEKDLLKENRNIPGHLGTGPDVWDILLEPQDAPPETDSRGNYILYHGTILSTAKEIIKTKLVKLSKGWGTGVTTTPWEAKSYAGMKRIDVGGLKTGEKAAVLQMVIDKDWFHKQVVQREIGGHGKNEFLIRGDIVPQAIKKIKIWRTFP